ncbi:MAG: thioesterase family protein [Woeseiaceae bacterium]
MSTGDEVVGVEVHAGKVLPEWIDFNGHMNVAYYVLMFDLGVDALWLDFGLNEDHIREQKSSTFAVESHVLYRRELKLDDPYIITSQLLAYDEKRIHQFQRMYHASDGFLAASAEWMHLHVDLTSRRVAPWPTTILDGIANVAASQADWPYPDEVGATMKIRNPLFSIGNTTKSERT